MSTLYWLHDDLRLQDNPALAAAAQDDALTMLFCIDEARFNTDRFGNRQMGAHRWRLLRESLLDLQHSLSELGQTLNPTLVYRSNNTMDRPCTTKTQ